MFQKILAKIFGTRNDRMLTKLKPLLQQVNSYEKEIQALSDDALSSMTNEFKEALANGQSLDDILPASGPFNDEISDVWKKAGTL